MRKWTIEGLNDDLVRSKDFEEAWKKRVETRHQSWCGRCGTKGEDNWRLPTESCWPLFVCQPCARDRGLQW